VLRAPLSFVVVGVPAALSDVFVGLAVLDVGAAEKVGAAVDPSGRDGAVVVMLPMGDVAAPLVAVGVVGVPTVVGATLVSVGDGVLGGAVGATVTLYVTVSVQASQWQPPP